ncbi:MAG: TldD/PmbA family protein, partial [Massilibacteroides sp.]|nr:TldD/PmbA family protein [Massilibacteroides sp.]
MEKSTVYSSLLGRSKLKQVTAATGVAFALEHFQVSESHLRKVLKAALEKGGDYADLYFEHTYRSSLGLQDGQVNRASSNIDYGMGVRVLSGDQTGYAYVKKLTLKEMVRAAKAAARIANGKSKDKVAALVEQAAQYNHYDVQTAWDDIA